MRLTYQQGPFLDWPRLVGGDGGPPNLIGDPAMV